MHNICSRGNGQVRVGVPRALLYYEYYVMWKTFFEELGAQIVVSEPTNAATVASGCSRLSTEICLPVRVFCGHALSLVGKCDYLFIPSVQSVEKKVHSCPKFIGLPDLIRANISQCPPVLDPDIDVNKGKKELYLTIYRLGRVFCLNPLHVRKAAEKAFMVHGEYRTQMCLKKLTIPQAIMRMASGEDHPESRRTDSDLTLAVVGHPYLIHDEHLSHKLLTKLQERGVNTLVPEIVKETQLRSSLYQLVERPYWTYEDEVVGAGSYYLQAETHGVISLIAFGCGPDSLMVDLLHRQAKRLSKPFLNLVIDEHTTETALVTRLEAFIDMIRRGREKLPTRVHYIPPRGDDTPRRINVLGLQSFGTIRAALRTVAKMLDIPVVAPPVTKKTLSLGTKYSPEFVCIPFKLILGNFIEALEQGADTLFMVTSVNACRLGYYAKVQEQILRDLGYDFQFLKFRSSQKGLIGVLKAVKYIANDAPWKTVIAAYYLGTAKLKALDDIERKVQKCRALEIEKGTADRIFRRAIEAIDEAPDLVSTRRVAAKYLGELNQVPGEKGFIPLKVGVVGEIYAVMEPFVNMNLEMELGKLGVQVRRTRTTFFSEWARLGSFNVLNEEKKRLRKFASPYLRRDIGGHGLESLAEKVRLSTLGFDGIVHLAPFTCMPEGVAANIMPSTVESIPVLTILCDEQLAKAGLLTRLEAFVDLLKWRRKPLALPG